MVDRAPGEGRYARLEREQRWTLSELPPLAERPAEILDRYIVGTRLRLRRVDTPTSVICKLTQKVRANEDDPEVVKITNTYLSIEEYGVVAALPAAQLRKSRWRFTWNCRRLAVDVFHDRLHGLVLAELELGPDEGRSPMPPCAVGDVTHDGRFAGGALALASDTQIGAILRGLEATERS